MGKINGRFTGEQVRLPEHLEMPTLKDMVPGSMGGVGEESLFIDGQRKCWLDGDAQFNPKFDGWEGDLTVICINEGLVIDLSQEQDKEARFMPSTTDEIVQDSGDNLIPVIGFLISEQDVLDFDKQFREQTGERFISKAVRKAIKKQLAKDKAESPSVDNHQH